MNDFVMGKKIKLGEDVEMIHKTFKKGHVFTIIGESYRGLDIEDEDGDRIYECKFIQHHFIPYDIKKERSDKINEINENRDNIRT